ncbi:hypothetical protein BgiMline_002189 [Biomphalaria glabrata]|nr:hypothetical protein BgiMline_002059 [Biomphalaria glabrata]KAI8774755.1 hypothetical protein BgiBS90_024577 [Biomphalaria glabrata]
MEDSWADNLIRITLLLVCYFVSSGTDESHSCRQAPFLEKSSFVSFLDNEKSTVNGMCPYEPARLSRSSHCLSYVHNFNTAHLADECMITSAKSLSTNKGNKSKAVEVKGQTKKTSGVVKKLKGSKRQRKKNKKKKLGKKKKRS